MVEIPLETCEVVIDPINPSYLEDNLVGIETVISILTKRLYDSATTSVIFLNGISSTCSREPSEPFNQYTERVAMHSQK